jgi:uncharacterized protein YjbI with pentapeptide repeats
MKTLISLVQEQYKDLLTMDLKPYLIAITGGQGVYQIINFNDNISCQSSQTNDPLLVAKTIRGLEKISQSIQTLVIVEASDEDVVWADEELAKLTQYRVVTIFDGYNLIKKYGENLDLSGANLRGAQLRGAKLQGANLFDADLRGACLERADLKEACLMDANLEGADLSYANINGANLENADMRRANLKYSDARKSVWKGAALRGAELWGAYFSNVDLNNAYTDGVDLSRADYRGA